MTKFFFLCVGWMFCGGDLGYSELGVLGRKGGHGVLPTAVQRERSCNPVVRPARAGDSSFGKLICWAVWDELVWMTVWFLARWCGQGDIFSRCTRVLGDLGEM